MVIIKEGSPVAAVGSGKEKVMENKPIWPSRRGVCYRGACPFGAALPGGRDGILKSGNLRMEGNIILAAHYGLRPQGQLIIIPG